MSVAERLKQYCRENGISQESLVLKGFGTKQTINNYLNGNTDVKSSFLERFIKEFRISASWLMTGEPEPDRDDMRSRRNYSNTEQPQSLKEPEPCKDCKVLRDKVKMLEKINDLQEDKIKHLEKELAKKEIASRNSAQAG